VKSVVTAGTPIFVIIQCCLSFKNSNEKSESATARGIETESNKSSGSSHGFPVNGNTTTPDSWRFSIIFRKISRGGRWQTFQQGGGKQSRFPITALLAARRSISTSFSGVVQQDRPLKSIVVCQRRRGDERQVLLLELFCRTHYTRSTVVTGTTPNRTKVFNASLSQIAGQHEFPSATGEFRVSIAVALSAFCSIVLLVDPGPTTNPSPITLPTPAM
jgi:hypothetical protein